MLASIKLEAYLPLDEGPISNLPHCGMVLLYFTTRLATDGKASNGYWPLCHCIDLAIGSAEWSEQQGSSLQTLGIAH